MVPVSLRHAAFCQHQARRAAIVARINRDRFKDYRTAIYWQFQARRWARAARQAMGLEQGERK